MDELTKYKFFAEHFDYCRESGEFTRKSDGKVMVATTNGYVTLHKKSLQLQAHRLAWFIEKGVPPVGILDHINRVRDDNRIENLREACAQRNGRNTSKHTTKEKGRVFTSQYKGVRLLSTHYKNGTVRRNPWQARIWIDSNKTGISLGCYPNEEGAAKAYDKAAKEHFGEFACLNFPEGR